MRRLRGPALFAITLLSCAPTFAQVFQNDGNTPDTTLATNGVRRNRYSMSGDVLNAANSAPLAKIQVTIRSDDGQTFLATLTDENGRFSFDQLPRSAYTVSVSIQGFQPAEERVDIQNGPALGVQIRPHSTTEPIDSPDSSRPAISAHELAAPARARDDLAKGEMLLYDKADFSGAIKQFEKAIKEFPGYYEAYAQLGVAYVQTKDAGKAETALRKSIELSEQKYGRAFVYLATLFSDNHRFADAEPQCRKAIELDANSWQGYHELTRALVGQNRLPDAEDAAQTAVKLAPGEPELYLTLINIEGKLPNYRAMLANINAYLKVAPDGRAAEQVRTIRTQVQQALAKAQSSPRTQTPSDGKP
jgi:Tfp pilus assembly protein PilF